MDRFGLRVIVRGLAAQPERLEAYRRVQAYLTKPRQVVSDYLPDTLEVQVEIQAARDRLDQVILPDPVAELGLGLVHQLNIDSLRAEITMFEAARAYAAIDGRLEVFPSDLRVVAPMSLRLRRSAYMVDYFSEQDIETIELSTVMDQCFGNP
jgi:Mg-chelatase subunit ChlI